jgi:hypothetical protein
MGSMEFDAMAAFSVFVLGAACGALLTHIHAITRIEQIKKSLLDSLMREASGQEMTQ